MYASSSDARCVVSSNSVILAGGGRGADLLAASVPHLQHALGHAA